MTRIGYVLLSAAAAAFVAGCSSSSSAPATAPVSGGDPVAAQKDPCALFTAGELDTAFGLHFATGVKEQGALEPTCDWSDSGAGVSAVGAVKKTTDANFDSDLSGPVKKDYERTTPVLGDDSVWFDPAATDTVSLLVIDRGYRYQVTIGLHNSDEKDQRRSQLLALAKATF